MEKLTGIIIHFKKTVVMTFLAAAVFCFFISNFVKVNYDMLDYLPEDAPSTTALDTMNEEYTQAPPNVRAIVRNVTIPQAREYQEQLEQVEYVESVNWLGDAVNVYEPLEYSDADTVEAWYKDQTALYSITVDDSTEESETAAVEGIRMVIGDDNAMSGAAVNNALAPKTTAKEVSQIICYVVPIVLAILLLTTTSWWEPFLFLLTIGIAILLNRGTNLMFGEISFVTNAAGSILQLAVSMDYSIFLLHRFAEYRKSGFDVETAMTKAVKKSFGSIMSSGLTTVTGFAALILMRFKIGPDMGYVMAKAIVFSLLCVVLFLPAATILTYKLIDKTEHRSLMPSFEGLANVVIQVRVPILLLFMLILLPCYKAQSANDFIYGASGIYGDEHTQIGADKLAVNELFGESSPIVVMVPVGSPEKEQRLNDALLKLDEVTSVISYANTVGKEIPVEFLPSETSAKLYSDHYSRFVVTLQLSETDKGAFDRIAALKQTIADIYGDEYLLAGDIISTSDLRDTVTEDNVRVNAVAIAAIFLILIMNFKSLTLPVILTLVIEASIWINLTIPYCQGTTLHYIAYLIIGTVQLGATIDYAILITDRYVENRRKMEKKEAVLRALSTSTLSVLTSSVILTLAGILLGIISTNLVLSQLGTLVGRGAAISVGLVLFVLPAALWVMDPVIRKTTYQANFVCKESPGKKEIEIKEL